MKSTPFERHSRNDWPKLADLCDRAELLLKPRPRSTPDAWALENRVYDNSKDRPGPRDVSLTPYMIPFERSFDVVDQVQMFGRRFDWSALACGAQMSKTDAVLDVIGQVMDQRPAPIMYVGPNKEFLNQEFEPRLMEMLTGTESLSSKLATGKKMNRFRKVVGGVPIILRWAGSGASLRATAAKHVFVDELDVMRTLGEEGDPFSILEGRGFSFADRMRSAISTPTRGHVDTYICDESGLEFWRVMDIEDVQSAIWRHWQKGTRHHWCWPCPECGEYFVPRFKLLRGIDEVTPAEAKKSAWLECPHCGGVIEDHHKAEMNARGRYVAPGQSVDVAGNVSGPLPDTTGLTFWVSGLASPFVSFGERAASYVEAKLAGDEADVQAKINVGFGECYAPGGGDVPEWHEVKACALPYRSGELPPGVLRLTLTADVQKTRILYVIRGWGDHASSWLIEAGEISGPTTHDTVWNKLATIVTTPIGDLDIHRAFIDSGYRPGKPYNLPVNKVYQFCRRFPGRVLPTKGRQYADKPVQIKSPEIKQKGEVYRYGLSLAILDTNHGKSWVHERIRWPSDHPGAWHVPEDVTDDYCKQIVSEARVRSPSGRPEWIQRSRENHYLDCEAMQAAICHWLRFDLLRNAPPRNRKTATKTARKAKAETERQTRRRAALTKSQAPDEAPISRQPKPPATSRRKRLDDLAARLYG